MIVADASAVVTALFNDGAAREWLARGGIAVPHLIDAELAHAVRGQVLRGAVEETAASVVLDAWSRLGVSRFPMVGLLSRIWELRDNLSAYDACYVALAEELDTTVVTADERLARAPGVRCSITVVRS